MTNTLILSEVLSENCFPDLTYPRQLQTRFNEMICQYSGVQMSYLRLIRFYDLSSYFDMDIVMFDMFKCSILNRDSKGDINWMIF